MIESIKPYQIQKNERQWKIDSGTNSYVVGDGDSVIKIYYVHKPNPFYTPQSDDHAQVLRDNADALRQAHDYLTAHPICFDTDKITWTIDATVPINDFHVFEPPKFIPSPWGDIEAHAVAYSRRVQGANIRQLMDKNGYKLATHLQELPNNEQKRIMNVRSLLYRGGYWKKVTDSLYKTSIAIQNAISYAGIFIIDLNVMIRMYDNTVRCTITDLAGDIRNIRRK